MSASMPINQRLKFPEMTPEALGAIFFLSYLVIFETRIASAASFMGICDSCRLWHNSNYITPGV